MLAVDSGGEVGDLTIRSFGILRAADMPHVEVDLVVSDVNPVNGSDAVFAAVAAAAWVVPGYPPQWPTRERLTMSHEHARRSLLADRSRR